MIERRSLVFTLVIALLVPAAAAAADAEIFHDLSSRDVLPSRDGAWEASLPRHFRVLEVDVEALESLLGRAPVERSAEAAKAPAVLALPYPDGTRGRKRSGWTS